MAVPRPELETPAELAAHVAGLRQGGQHIAPVLWQGRPAWLKLSVPQPPAWRYQLQGGAARLLGLTALQPVRPQGGAAGIRNEATRLAALAAAGLHVPQVLAGADHWLLLSDLGRTTLEFLLRHADDEARLAWWREGAGYIHRVHAAGQYLGQPFARNLVWSPDGGLGAIDFEDDPGRAMPLSLAQVRDWMPYLFSTAVRFADRLPRLSAEVAEVLAREDRAVREGVVTLLRRTAWVRIARGLPRGMQRRDVVNTRCYGELARLCTAAVAAGGS